MAKEMIKRADGSYSQRGLWDNIRAAKGSGKKPTAEMLKQERKIKAKSKAEDGYQTKKPVVASFKRTVGDSAALKRKADSLGMSTNKAKDALKARIAAKKAGAMKKGGKVSKSAKKK